MKKLPLYALLCSVLSWNGCPGAVTNEYSSYSDATNASSDTENKEETNRKRRSSAADTLPEDTPTGPIIPPSCYPSCTDLTVSSEINLADTYTEQLDILSTEVNTKDLSISKETYVDSNLFSPDTSSQLLPEIYSGETSPDSYFYPETEGDSGNEDSENVINYPDALEDLVKNEEECYTLAKEEFLSYSIENVESPGEQELYLMVGKYSGENDCLALYDDSGEAYPEICTYLYAYFFSDQPFGYFHCSGSEDIGVGESLPDYCYYEVKLPATPKEIKDTATEAVECIYNGLGWNQD